ncbi:hypothetical protein [Nocardioides sp.]|uniref:hypothetical protein n=1 Tax=Nocardioides sp. TaxID=35761 RepID=UPI00271844C4|nr:hypothetical protein [Nocardioides sp.]MDO9457007.1 hypothetical protein [Nocardioides sp.]
MPTDTTSPLPVSGRLAWWATAWLRGHVGPDDLLDGVLDGDVTHLVLGPDTGLVTTLASLRAAGATAFGAAFPAEGDPVGLGGPSELNAAALEAGEAVVALGADAALVPTRVGPTVEWTLLPARRRPLPDVGEADRALRGVLLDSADRLAALDVARWRPEVADRLMNLRHRPAVAAPPGIPPRCVDLASRGLQALGIAELALEDDGGALTVVEMEQRRSALAPLARAGRRALVAACSPEVWPPD